jgi:transposase
MRLKHARGASLLTIARAVGVGHTSVAEYVRRASVVGITWPIPAEIDDAELEPTRPVPHWAYVHEELRRRGVTLVRLWEEYRAEHAGGYGYSRFAAQKLMDLEIAAKKGAVERAGALRGGKAEGK